MLLPLTVLLSFQVIPAAYGVPEIHPNDVFFEWPERKNTVIAWKEGMVSRTDCSKARVLRIS